MQILKRIFDWAGGTRLEVPQPVMTVPKKQFPKKPTSAHMNLPGAEPLTRQAMPHVAAVDPEPETLQPLTGLSAESLLEEVIDGFDQAFDSAYSPLQAASHEVKDIGTEADETAVQSLFDEIATNYARPVKNFVVELSRGTASKDCLEICRTALRSIQRAAESMNLIRAANRMKDFDETLLIAQTTSPSLIDREARLQILASYQRLVEVLPQVFLTGQQEQSYEDVIIQSLLKQIPGLGRVTFRKLYGAGLVSLNTLLLANKQDLNVTTGIPLELCEQICNKFQQYRSETEARESSQNAVQAACSSRLANLVKNLRFLHEKFEHSHLEMGSNPAPADEKRRLRQQRQQCFLQIVVVLAELKEIDLINAVRKLPFRRRLQRLKEYLARPTG
jgi:hypothetical protein